MVDPPTVEDTISILRGLRERFEVHHGVKIQDNALVAAAVLSNRYITDRFLPDKAIDLVDEACAMIRTEIDSMPTELDEVDPPGHAARDRGGGAQEGEGQGQQGAPGLTAPRAGRPQERGRCHARSVGVEKAGDRHVRALREEIEGIRIEIEKAERDYDLNERPSFATGKLPDLQAAAGETRRRLGRRQGEARLLREEVTEDEIAEIVSKWTGIPVTRLVEGEREKLLRLDEILHRG